jgi:hypothetical protein
MSEPSRRLTLSDLPFAARLTLAAFLISVGVGYFSALVQLHVQQAKGGQLLPGTDEVIAAYHGQDGVSTLERLIMADEHKPFNATGSMRKAFTERAMGWKKDIPERKREIDKLPDEEKEKRLAEIEKRWLEQHKGLKLPTGGNRVRTAAELELREERAGEAATVVAWVRGGPDKQSLDKQSYEDDDFSLPESLKGMRISEQFILDDAEPEDSKPRRVMIKSIISQRCVRCHKEGVSDPAAAAPLDNFERLEAYGHPESERGMPLMKLAQSTHVHLLGFSMLYGLTGLIFACSSWPGILRFLIAPLPLVAQLVDISFWWLARLQDPWGSEFAKGIRYTGMVVAAGLGLQIILSLFSLFGWFGRFVLVLLMAAALVGAYYLNDQYIGPYLAQQARLSGL